MGWRNLNSDWSKSMCDRCRTRHLLTTVSSKHPALLFDLCVSSTSVSLRRHPRTLGRSPGWLQDGLVSVGQLPQAGERGWNVFWLQQVDTSRWKTGDICSPAFTTPPNTTHWISPTLSASLLWPQTVPTLYFHHLTHIQNCFLVGAAPEMRPKPLIQLQITGWKTVTSALGRSASHGSSSSPSLGDTLFSFFLKSHSHILCHATSPSCPLSSYCTTKLAFVLSKYFTQT